MKKTIQNVIVTVTFCAFLAVFVVLCVVKLFHPTEISESERRPLALSPAEITWEGIMDKTVMDQFEDYTVDQFPFREFFRSVKANLQINILHMKEYNGLAIQDGYMAKIQPAFSDDLVEASLGRLRYIHEKFLTENGGKIYVSLIPDKNYYLGRDHGYPSPDYDALAEKLRVALPNAEYVDIFDCLKLEDYYRTDIHWSQEKISAVVDRLAEALGVSDDLSGHYTETRLEGFKGVYYGQSALHPKPDTLVYLTNETLNACTVFDYETGKTGSLYTPELFEGKDGYDVFLSGTRALLRIDNPNAATDKELVIFRDSFGSSLAPLLAEGYQSIYVVDIRYIMPDFLGQLIEFEGKDVLFIYSAPVLNQNAFK